MSRSQGLAIDQIDDPFSKFKLIVSWIKAFSVDLKLDYSAFIEETSAFFLIEKSRINLINFSLFSDLKGLIGDHANIVKGKYHLNYHSYYQKLVKYAKETVPLFNIYTTLKKELINQP